MINTLIIIAIVLISSCVALLYGSIIKEFWDSLTDKEKQDVCNALLLKKDI